MRKHNEEPSDDSASIPLREVEPEEKGAAAGGHNLGSSQGDSDDAELSALLEYLEQM